MKAIFAREIKGLFNTLTGYIFIALYLLCGGILFAAFNLIEGSAKITSVLSGMQYILMILIPIMTVGIFKENKDSASRPYPQVALDRTLLSAPVSSGQIAAGKFLSAFSVFLTALIVTFIYPLILAALGSVSFGETVSGFLGLILYGGMMISISLSLSSLIRNRVAALITTIAVMLAILAMEVIIPYIKNPWVVSILYRIAPSSNLNYFMSGIISLFSTVYFLSITVLFVILTGKAIENKRWS